PCATLHLDESHVGEGLVVVRVRFPRDEVEAAVVLLYALNHPATLGLVANRLLDRKPLNLLVADHRRDAWGCTLGMWKHPGAAEVLDVTDGEIALHSKFGAPSFETVI